MTLETPANLTSPEPSSETPSPKPQARERGQGVRPPQPSRTVKRVAFHDKIAFAREQRREPTQLEDRLWEHLRGRRHGVKLRRQHPVDDFVLDFYCPAAKLAIEIDGPHHERQAQYDQWRTEQLQRRGIRMLRLREQEVSGDLARAVERIVAACQEP